jgi:hypothetical protein
MRPQSVDRGIILTFGEMVGDMLPWVALLTIAVVLGLSVAASVWNPKNAAEIGD